MVAPYWLFLGKLTLLFRNGRGPGKKRGKRLRIRKGINLIIIDPYIKLFVEFEHEVDVNFHIGGLIKLCFLTSRQLRFPVCSLARACGGYVCHTYTICIRRYFFLVTHAKCICCIHLLKSSTHLGQQTYSSQDLEWVLIYLGWWKYLHRWPYLKMFTAKSADGSWSIKIAKFDEINSALKLITVNLQHHCRNQYQIPPFASRKSTIANDN